VLFDTFAVIRLDLPGKTIEVTFKYKFEFEALDILAPALEAFSVMLTDAGVVVALM
jgi:hypothetical protein